jgi:hypothetical protein
MIFAGKTKKVAGCLRVFRNSKQVNASSFSDEAEEFEKTLLPRVIRLAAGEGNRPYPRSKTFLGPVQKKWLLLFPHHLNCFLRALVGTDAAALTEIQVDLKVIIDNRIGAVGGTESAGIALLFVNNRPEYPPGPGFTGCSFDRSAHGQPVVFL